MDILPHSPDALQRAITLLRSGGVVAHATETCYGLACDLTNLAAVEKLFRIKNRPVDQPISVLFSSVEEAKKWVQWNEKAEELARASLPGPLTIILPRAVHPSAIYTMPATDLSRQSTIGVRISSHPIAQILAEMFGSPLSTTSANVHGEKNPYSTEEITEQYRSLHLRPDLLLDSGALAQNPSSRIIEIRNNEVHVLRSA